MKKLTHLLSGVLIVVALLVAPLVLTTSVSAAGVDVFNTACQGNNANAEFCQNRGVSLFGDGSIWDRIVNTLIFIIGALAVIMIIVGGLRYVLSGGDQSAVNTAKNTILYSVVGLIVAVLARPIINFVIGVI